MMFSFKAQLNIIGINPFVYLPANILSGLFEQAGKDKGPIPVCGQVNGRDFRQSLVKYKGEWRLYINTTMLKDSPRRIGEEIMVNIRFDPDERIITPHPLLLNSLENNKEAQEIFNRLIPSEQKEIIRYISQLKTEKSIINNVEKAIGYLLGKNSFIGRKAKKRMSS
jgi:hypothetical protein